MNFLGKRYTVWHDESLQGKEASESGLSYGVYDNETNEKCTEEKQGGIITTYEMAKDRAIKMNLEEQYSVRKFA